MSTFGPKSVGNKPQARHKWPVGYASKDPDKLKIKF